MTRAEARLASAEYINALSRDELFKRFAITRVAKIDGLDQIGVPVYSACRPASKTISVSAGKSSLPEMARAGSIAEGIEFHTFENPAGDFVKARCEVKDLPLAKGSKWTPDKRIRLQPVRHYASGKCVLYPSDLIWMGRWQKDWYFMGSSNGQAIGATFDDAFLTGLYEVIERDQWMLRRISLLQLGVYPPRVTIPESLSYLEEKIAQASLKIYLMRCTVDIPVPVYWAALVDTWSGTGSYIGYGCHLSERVAAERAVLEAIQSRAVYIAGARDDIERRDFLTVKTLDCEQLNKTLSALPVQEFPMSGMEELTVQQEINEVVWRLGSWAERIYYKDINLKDLHAVKVLIPGLECPSLGSNEAWWQSTGRWEALRKKVLSTHPA